METYRSAGPETKVSSYALAVILICAGTGDVFADTNSQSQSCYKKQCEQNVLVPMVRIAVVEMGMHAGLLLIWPESFDPSDVNGNRAQLRRSWTGHPKLIPGANIFDTDGDWWYFNLSTHALFGSEAYLAARGWKHSPIVAFLYAALASFTWEYLVEGWYQQPSAIDLFWTPMGGSLLGELRYQGYLAAKRRIARRVPRTIVLTLLDPLGELERLILGCEI